MKTLTLHQPWASLIIHGHKTLETRSWTTRHRGPIAIHAGRTWNRDLMYQTQRFRLNYPALANMGEQLPLGCVLGIVEIKGCYRTENIRDQVPPMDLTFGNFDDGRFAWHVKVIEVFEQPIPARGAQGLWEWNLPPASEIYGGIR